MPGEALGGVGHGIRPHVGHAGGRVRAVEDLGASVAGGSRMPVTRARRSMLLDGRGGAACRGTPVKAWPRRRPSRPARPSWPTRKTSPGPSGTHRVGRGRGLARRGPSGRGQGGGATEDTTQATDVEQAGALPRVTREPSPLRCSACSRRSRTCRNCLRMQRNWSGPPSGRTWTPPRACWPRSPGVNFAGQFLVEMVGSSEFPAEACRYSS